MFMHDLCKKKRVVKQNALHIENEQFKKTVQSHLAI